MYFKMIEVLILRSMRKKSIHLGPRHRYLRFMSFQNLTKEQVELK